MRSLCVTCTDVAAADAVLLYRVISERAAGELWSRILNETKQLHFIIYCNTMHN